MSSKVKEVIKDGVVGIGIGTAIIIPGISGGTIALITGVFKKIVNAVDDLFTKRFWKNLLITLDGLVKQQKISKLQVSIGLPVVKPKLV